mgnify:CR=1 FL=1
MPQDSRKAHELCLRAGELGYSLAYDKLGDAYLNGQWFLVHQVSAVWRWEYKEYSSLEDAIMDEFDAKSVEEAIWDNAGVERISVIWPEEMMNMDEEQFRAEASKRMKKAGWKYIGYKLGSVSVFVKVPWNMERGLLEGVVGVAMLGLRTVIKE